MRKAFLVVNALLTLSLIAQLYFAALGVFSPPEDELFRFHAMNGRFILPVLIIVWIVFGFIARIGRTSIILTFVGLVLLALQTGYFLIAGAMGATPPPNEYTPGATPYVLALHGLGGTLLLLLTVWVFFRVRGMGPLGRSSAETTASEPVTSTPTT
ncbi:DUF6220 domain-containing protein [Microbacterium ulmi]|uniref:Uncharacterized protein n=1 Tax=Microbacterium ulmi TaxID=179095 RepID=A0A7Y2M1Y0_9MICO|nr:DUF6220 domain-containing protein [Microbacterium ulmi]NII69698.1 putative membrane protein [Microbacterium ulmi]NNH05001.1 hypothetical protein [Microbacterium ulmi]